MNEQINNSIEQSDNHTKYLIVELEKTKQNKKSKYKQGIMKSNNLYQSSLFYQTCRKLFLSSFVLNCTGF